MQDYTKFLDIPSLKGLEKEILGEFGRRGLERFKKCDLRLESVLNPLPDFKYQVLPLKGDKNLEVGKLIDLSNRNDVLGYLVKNAYVYSGMREGYSQVLIDFDLNKDKILRVAFKI